MAPVDVSKKVEKADADKKVLPVGAIGNTWRKGQKNKKDNRGAHLRKADADKVSKKVYVPTGKPIGRPRKAEADKVPKRVPTGKPTGRPKATTD